MKPIILSKQDCSFFGDAMEQRFLQDVFHAIKSDMPAVTHLVDDDAIRAIICYGVKRAESYGIEDADLVKDFIYLLHSSVGFMFDENPIHFSVRSVLSENKGETEKLDYMKHHIKNYTDLLFSGNDFAKSVTKYLDNRSIRNSSDPFSQMQSDIMYIFRQKYELIDQSRMNMLINHVRRELTEFYKITQPTNQAEICVSVFLFGFRVYNDPFFPAIRLFPSSEENEDKRTGSVNAVLRKRAKYRFEVMKQSVSRF